MIEDLNKIRNIIVMWRNTWILKKAIPKRRSICFMRFRYLQIAQKGKSYMTIELY
jgi:hypothetical protein